MGPHGPGGRVVGKNVRAAARFLATYGRLPQEFTPETALGLYGQITAIEAARALEIARGIGIAFGSGKALAAAVFETTGSAALAHRIDVQEIRRKAQDGD